MNSLPRDRLLLDYSRSSDIGVWREGREREKNKEEKSERERRGNSLALTPTPPPPSFFFFCSHLFALSPRTERLEQTRKMSVERQRNGLTYFKPIRIGCQCLALRGLLIPHESLIAEDSTCKKNTV